MKFVINTAVDPHFCAIFDEKKLIDADFWTNRRADGERTWKFLEKFPIEKINFAGGVAGPGGFSSLRVVAGILNAISFAKKIPLRQVSADVWIRQFLISRGHPDAQFLLNSFGDGVFFRNSHGKLQKLSVVEATAKFADTEVFVALLPPEKQKCFSKKLDLKFTDSVRDLLDALESAPKRENFVPEYGFSPV